MHGTFCIEYTFCKGFQDCATLQSKHYHITQNTRITFQCTLHQLSAQVSAWADFRPFEAWLGSAETADFDEEARCRGGTNTAVL